MPIDFAEDFCFRKASKAEMTRIFSEWPDSEEELVRHRQIYEEYGFENCFLLVDKITSIKEEFRRKKKELEGNEVLKELLGEAQVLRDQASEFHEKVVSSVNLAQEHHDKMSLAFKAVDKVRAEADAAHKDFVTAQETADAAHRQFIKCQNELSDFDKVITSLKRSNRETKENKERIKVKRKAEEIYNQFKNGEKLDTEDLLLLQRSGFL